MVVTVVAEVVVVEEEGPVLVAGGRTNLRMLLPVVIQLHSSLAARLTCHSRQDIYSMVADIHSSMVVDIHSTVAMSSMAEMLLMVAICSRNKAVMYSRDMPHNRLAIINREATIRWTVVLSMIVVVAVAVLAVVVAEVVVEAEVVVVGTTGDRWVTWKKMGLCS